MEENNSLLREKNILIARRVPIGDRWRLTSEEPDGIVHKSLTDALEAYMLKTEFKGEYRLNPLKSELYAIETEEYEINKEPPKSYSLYGEH
jgi:hypothetical protein